ncbi:MAG: prepilin-type N-terminal cleavage/methylation domain-containing protein, partial [Burkholderiales bacterium]|nr:prepilin-type N-terminal cleavage/methylation domain-containing protein [Burkholderiales bacterium]
MKQQRQSGFTLVEIAIVLVIIGLLLGGILKGQELITNAKVRNVADQQTSVKAAFFAFQDRFRALPGDYLQATINIPNVTTNGDGDGRIGSVPESIRAWNHLTNAGFISCSQCTADLSTDAGQTQNNSPTNAFGGVLFIQSDNVYLNAPTGGSNNLKTGASIPSNVLVEVDRKIDDGAPGTGAIRFSTAGGALQAD